MPPAADWLGASVGLADGPSDGAPLGDAAGAPVLVQATTDASSKGVTARDARRRGWFDMAAGRRFVGHGSETNLLNPPKTLDAARIFSARPGLRPDRTGRAVPLMPRAPERRSARTARRAVHGVPA